jgi:hypothetical protein
VPSGDLDTAALKGLAAVLVHTYHEVFPMLAADLLERRKMQFTLWRPNGNQNAPKLVIGTFQAGNPNVVANRLELPLATSAATPGLRAYD